MDKPLKAAHYKHMRSLVLSAVFLFAVFLFIMEKLFPLRRQRAGLRSRLFANFSLAFLTFLTAAVFVRPVSLNTLSFSAARHWGLLASLDLPPLAQYILGFALLDLSFYYWHRLNHKISWLWRFHNVHHIDPDLDVSTAFRFHYFEVFLSSGFRFAQIILIGPSLGVFLAYEAVFQCATFFHHSNWRLRPGIEGVLRLLAVTPRMHGIHHSNYQSETDSNYSVVFSVWDRLHKTYLDRPDQKDIVIGVPGYARPEDNLPAKSLGHPFKKQRDYWGGRLRR